ncbi:MAG: hypothetical protein ACHQ03_04350 [Candidatus Bathyarchaeia archaeon]
MTKIYDRFMKFDKRVRFAALVDTNGRILEGGMREGVQPLEPLEKTPHLIARLVSVQKHEDFATFFGKPEYSILIHEDIIAAIFHSGRKYALVTIDRKFSLEKIEKLHKLAARSLR